MSKRIWCISDTHTRHNELTIPENIDIAIHAGDASNIRDSSFNEAEMREFLRWFDSLPVKHKIFVPGNHDTSIEKGMFNFDDYTDIKFLINESVVIDGIKIYGSPITPTFGSGWAYNCQRHKIFKHWDNIPEDTDILVTHGPPKGILDLTFSGGGGLVQTGCKVLLNKVHEINPNLHIFGHIHDEDLIYNAGCYCEPDGKTTFVNASVCNLRYKVANNGIIIDYEDKETD